MADDAADRILTAHMREEAPLPGEGHNAEGEMYPHSSAVAPAAALPVSRGRLSKLERATRDRRIIALALGGAAPDRIAQVLAHTEGYPVDVGVINGAIRRATVNAQKLPTREADAMRELAVQRLDAMLLAIWPKVMEGNLRAIDRSLSIERQRYDLLGLKPSDDDVGGAKHQHLHLHGVTAEEVDQVTVAWQEQATADEPSPPEIEAAEEDPAVRAFTSLPDVDGHAIGE